MIRFKARILAVAAALIASHAAHAQRNVGIELGVDGEVRREITEQATVVQIPISRIRAGFQISPIISIEPAVHLAYVTVRGNNDGFADFLVGVLFHLQPDRGRVQPYVRPFVELEHSSSTVGSGTAAGEVTSSVNETALGAGLGVKIPVARALATRIEGTYGHTLQRDGQQGRNTVSLFVGLSYFTGH